MSISLTKTLTLPSTEPCTGCGLCSSVCPQSCIQMVESKEGFFIPHVDAKKCIGCGVCLKVCSKRDVVEKGQKQNTICYEVSVNDLNERMLASSGGFCTELARKILQVGGVVYGVTMSENFRAKYIEVTDEHGLILLRGSKYVHADTTGVFKLVAQRLKEKRRVLFIGTSCVIRGLRVRFGFTNPFLLALDIACYGVPSYHLLDAYIREFNIGEDKIKKIYFKNKLRGWRNNSLRLVFESGAELFVPAGESSFIQGFDTRLCLNLSCYSCLRSPVHRISDITCADYWGHEDKEGDNSHMGISCVLCHTEAGKHALKLIRESIMCNKISLESAQKNNFGLIDKIERIPKDRNFVLQQLKEYHATAVIRRFVYAHGGKRIGFKVFGWRIYLPEKLYILLRSIVRKIRSR